MNQFAEYCRQLFAAEGTTIYQFCALHHLERTGIRRMLSGERLPKKELFEAFTQALTLTPEENEKIHMLYERQTVGEKKYDNRIFIRRLLEYIGDIQAFHPCSQTLSAESRELGLSEIRPVTVIQNSVELNYTIHCILELEQNSLCCNIPVIHNDFFHTLQQTLICKKGSVPFYHLFAVPKKTDCGGDVNQNLKILKTVLPFAIHNQTNYQPFYFYGNQPEGQDASLFPYYLLGSSLLLLLSSDFSKGLLYTEPTIITAYREEFEAFLSRSHTFIYHTQEPIAALTHYQRSSQTDARLLYTFDFFPCLLKIYSRELFLPHFLGQPEDFLPILDMLDALSVPRQSFDAFLSYEGLMRFSETGELGTQYRKILKPFSAENRLKILKKIEAFCKEGSYHLHILPEKYLRNLPEITIELYADGRISLLLLNSKTYFSFFFLEENSIFEAFLDYFESLAEYPQVSSCQDSIRILEQLCRKLEESKS